MESIRGDSAAGGLGGAGGKPGEEGAGGAGPGCGEGSWVFLLPETHKKKGVKADGGGSNRRVVLGFGPAGGCGRGWGVAVGWRLLCGAGRMRGWFSKASGSQEARAKCLRR